MGGRVVLRLIGAIALVYLAGFAFFVVTLPRADPVSARADGIVDLTGGEARLDAAVNLLEKGAAKRLLVTGVNGVTTRAMLKKLSHGGKRFECCADLGYAAEDTHGNALEAAVWAERHRYKSLIVVTANYHMPRALMEFGTEMPAVKLIAYPVEPSGTATSWWQSAGSLHLLHGEYLKYLAALVTTRLETPEAHQALDHVPVPGKSHPTA